jgi:hypothetical protein
MADKVTQERPLTRNETRWAIRWSCVVMLITCLPYLYVAAGTPPGMAFSRLLYQVPDNGVYLSWEEQAAQGALGMRNLFTGEAQRGIYLHLLSWLLGTLARLTGLPVVLVHHGGRLLLGALVLILAYRLFARLTPDVATRRTAFWFTAFASGFGWLAEWLKLPAQWSTELAQAEMTTFLSLCSNVLNCAGLALMLGIFLLLLAAEEQTGRRRWQSVLGAGLLGLLLGNVHSYDVITVACVWGAYIAARALTSRVTAGDFGFWILDFGLPADPPDAELATAPPPIQNPKSKIQNPRPRPFSAGRALVDALVAALVALPATGYQYYLYRTEPVFRLRADQRLPSPPLLCNLAGYGLLLLLAIGGAVLLVRSLRRAGAAPDQRLFPLVWAIVGLMTPYLPVSFQGKLVMGEHLPLALLAAMGALALVGWVTGHGSRVTGQRRGSARLATLDSRPVTAVVVGLLLVMVPTNVRFVLRDIPRRGADVVGPSSLPVYVPQADAAALQWARQHLPKDRLILCSYVSGLLFPAMAGRPVYLGHWSETVDARRKFAEVMAFYAAPDAASEERRAFLEARHIRYVYLGARERQISDIDFAGDPIFSPVYCKDGSAIYELRARTAALAQRSGER